MSDRLAALRETLNDLDAILINEPDNRRYLSGFTGSAGVLIISKDVAILATDFRYYTQVTQEATQFTLAEVGYGFTDHLPKLLKDLNARRVGFESQHLTVSELETWKNAVTDVDWCPTTGRVEALRAIKSEAEIDTLRRAVQVADQALERARKDIHPGVTEREVVWSLKTAMHDIGDSEPSFEIIVASGLSSAKPHARAGDTEIPIGVPIVIDMGALVDGYRSDMTRTLVLGEPDETFLKVYPVVLDALDTAEKGILPGITGKEGDALARDLISDAGYGDQFGHGLGHSLGLAIHESPRLSFLANDDPLLANTMMTVEPGIYLPEWGGIRIEDLVVIRESGVEILTETPKRLEDQIIPI